MQVRFDEIRRKNGFFVIMRRIYHSTGPALFPAPVFRRFRFSLRRKTEARGGRRFRARSGKTTKKGGYSTEIAHKSRSLRVKVAKDCKFVLNKLHMMQYNNYSVRYIVFIRMFPLCTRLKRAFPRAFRPRNDPIAGVRLSGGPSAGFPAVKRKAAGRRVRAVQRLNRKR